MAEVTRRLIARVGGDIAKQVVRARSVWLRLAALWRMR